MMRPDPTRRVPSASTACSVHPPENGRSSEKRLSTGSSLGSGPHRPVRAPVSSCDVE